MTNEPMTDEAMAEFKTSLVKLNATWNAQLILLHARIESLAGLLLALCHRLSFDKDKTYRLLTAHEKSISLDRLVALENRDPLLAAHTAAFLEEWLDLLP
jgi:hypothetical protein